MRVCTTQKFCTIPLAYIRSHLTRFPFLSPPVFGRLDYPSLDLAEPVANASHSIGGMGLERAVQLAVGSTITFSNKQRRRLDHSWITTHFLRPATYLCRSIIPRSVCGCLPNLVANESLTWPSLQLYSMIARMPNWEEQMGETGISRPILVESGSGKLGEWSALLYLDIPFPHRYPTSAARLIR